VDSCSPMLRALDATNMLIWQAHGHAHGHVVPADMVMIFYPRWVAGADADMNFSSWVWVYEVYIRTDIIRCHLYIGSSSTYLATGRELILRLPCAI
jgi:hypothetical protein